MQQNPLFLQKKTGESSCCANRACITTIRTFWIWP